MVENIKPVGGIYEIDWDDALTEDLRFAVLANGVSAYEAVRGIPLAHSGSIGHSVLANGPASDLDDTDYLELPHHSSYNLTGDITLLWGGGN